MNIEVNIKDHEFTLTIDNKIELKGNAIKFTKGLGIRMYYNGKWSGIHATGDNFKQLRDNLVKAIKSEHINLTEDKLFNPRLLKD